MEDTLEQAGRPIAERFPAIRVISRTARSVVYLARDAEAGRAVALKVLLAPHRPEPALWRTLRNARRMAELRHPHVVPVLEAGSIGGTPYVVSAYLEGETLRRRLDRDRQLPLRDAAMVAAQVADALAHLHQHGIGHGAVSAKHVVLSGGRALLLASEASTPDPTDERGDDQVRGHDESADLAVRDLIGLGSLLYETISGHPPSSPDQDAQGEWPLVPLSLLRPSTPATLEMIVDDALHGETHTASELGERLRQSAGLLTAIRCSGFRDSEGPREQSGDRVIAATTWWGVLAVLAALGLLGLSVLV
jgi:hypothetical protein